MTMYLEILNKLMFTGNRVSMTCIMRGLKSYHNIRLIQAACVKLERVQEQRENVVNNMLLCQCNFN